MHQNPARTAHLVPSSIVTQSSLEPGKHETHVHEASGVRNRVNALYHENHLRVPVLRQPLKNLSNGKMSVDPQTRMKTQSQNFA